MTGASIALLGIDGAGKSSLITPLREALHGAGKDTVQVGWKAALAEGAGDDTYPGVSLQQLYVEAWRLFFAGSTVSGGHAVDQLLPRHYSDFEQSTVMAELDGPPVGTKPSGLLASAMVEFTVDYVLQAEVVRPAMRDGRVTVADGFGFKNVTKVLRLAGELPGGGELRDALDSLIEFVGSAYSSPFLQPSIGIFLDVAPEMAYEWRMRQGGLGFGEDYGVAGRSGRDSYLDLQTTMSNEYRRMARDWGWLTVEVAGLSQPEVASAVCGAVLSHPAVSHTPDSRTRG